MKFFLIVMLYSGNFSVGPFDSQASCEATRDWVIQQALDRGYRGTDKHSRCVAS